MDDDDYAWMHAIGGLYIIILTVLIIKGLYEI